MPFGKMETHEHLRQFHENEGTLHELHHDATKACVDLKKRHGSVLDHIDCHDHVSEKLSYRREEL